MQKLVLIRHGESVWNKENRFTGWTDVDLADEGYAQAKHAGELLKKHGPKETEASIANKISRGTFSATFLLASLVAIGAETVRLEDI